MYHTLNSKYATLCVGEYIIIIYCVYTDDEQPADNASADRTIKLAEAAECPRVL